MIKLYYKNHEQKKDNKNIEIKVIEDRLTLIINNTYLKDFYFTEIFNTFTEGEEDFICSIYGSETGVGEVFKYRPSRADERELISSIDSRNKTQILVQIYFHGIDNYVLSVPYYNVIRTVGIEEIECEDNPHIQAQNEFPSYQQRRENILKKKKLLSLLDCNDSLSGNECQVDILTKIVKIIADKYKDSIIKDFPEYDEFFKAVDDTSILTLKTTSKCISDMKKQKEKIREVQKEYFND